MKYSIHEDIITMQVFHDNYALPFEIFITVMCLGFFNFYLHQSNKYDHIHHLYNKLEVVSIMEMRMRLFEQNAVKTVML